MPVRKIKKSYRSVTGVLASSKNNRMIASESTLERDLFNILEFDPLVVSYEEQPLTITYQASVEKNRKYTPDVIIYLDQNPEFIWRYSPFSAFYSLEINDDLFSDEKFVLKPKLKIAKPLAILGEVKYRAEFFEIWKDIKPKIKAARKYAEEKRWQFRIFTEQEIRTQLLANIKFIRFYGRYKFDLEEIFPVINKLNSLGQCSVQELLSALEDNQQKQWNLIPLIWYLVYLHEVEIDWYQPFTLEATLISVT